MKTKIISLIGGVLLIVLTGCTHYETEPTFGKVPDIVCQIRAKSHKLQRKIDAASTREENAKYSIKQRNLFKQLPTIFHEENVNEIIGNEIPVECQADYFSIDKLVITGISEDGDILLKGKILFKVNFKSDYDLGHIRLNTNLCDMTGTPYNSKYFASSYKFSSQPQAFVCVREAHMGYKPKYPKQGEYADFLFSIPCFFFEHHYRRGCELPVKVTIEQIVTLY